MPVTPWWALCRVSSASDCKDLGTITLSLNKGTPSTCDKHSLCCQNSLNSILNSFLSGGKPLEICSHNILITGSLATWSLSLLHYIGWGMLAATVCSMNSSLCMQAVGSSVQDIMLTRATVTSLLDIVSGPIWIFPGICIIEKCHLRVFFLILTSLGLGMSSSLRSPNIFKSGLWSVATNSLGCSAWCSQGPTPQQEPPPLLGHSVTQLHLWTWTLPCQLPARGTAVRGYVCTDTLFLHKKNWIPVLL